MLGVTDVDDARGDRGALLYEGSDGSAERNRARYDAWLAAEAMKQKAELSNPTEYVEGADAANILIESEDDLDSLDTRENHVDATHLPGAGDDMPARG